MAKQKTQVTEVQLTKRGKNRDSQATMKLSLSLALGFARNKRLSSK